MMNKRQMLVVLVALCLVAVSILVPPWRLRSDDPAFYGVPDRISYSPVWRTPYLVPKGERYKTYLTVELPVLALEWAAIAGAAAVFMFLLRRRRQRPSEDALNH